MDACPDASPDPSKNVNVLQLIRVNVFNVVFVTRNHKVQDGSVEDWHLSSILISRLLK